MNINQSHGQIDPTSKCRSAWVRVASGVRDGTIIFIGVGRRRRAPAVRRRRPKHAGVGRKTRKFPPAPFHARLLSVPNRTRVFYQTCGSCQSPHAIKNGAKCEYVPGKCTCTVPKRTAEICGEPAREKHTAGFPRSFSNALNAGLCGVLSKRHRATSSLHVQRPSTVDFNSTCFTLTTSAKRRAARKPILPAALYGCGPALALRLPVHHAGQ